jgi:nucleoside 2-deoxyribosyltransferase
MRVYLSGPITGHSEATIKSWRYMAAERLSQIAEVIDPTLSHYDSEVAFETEENPTQAINRLRHGLFVIRRNRNLIRSSDVILANLMGAHTRASVGSIGEICWADAFGKQVIIVREKHGNVHDHAMLNAIASQLYYNLEDAFAAIVELAAVADARMQVSG